jgi:hypothetical protein
MPNWCENELTVQGDPAYLTKIQEEVGGVDQDGAKLALSFATVVPCPADTTDVRDWNITHWGTKWEIEECPTVWNIRPVVRDNPLEADCDEIALYFNTAWSPPIPIVEALATRYPEADFTLRYCEMGCVFAGYRQYIAGELTESADIEAEDDVRGFAEEWFGYSFDDYELDEEEDSEEEDTSDELDPDSNV